MQETRLEAASGNLRKDKGQNRREHTGGHGAGRDMLQNSGVRLESSTGPCNTRLQVQSRNDSSQTCRDATVDVQDSAAIATAQVRALVHQGDPMQMYSCSLEAGTKRANITTTTGEFTSTTEYPGERPKRIHHFGNNAEVGALQSASKRERERDRERRGNGGERKRVGKGERGEKRRERRERERDFGWFIIGLPLSDFLPKFLRVAQSFVA